MAEDIAPTSVHQAFRAITTTGSEEVPLAYLKEAHLSLAWALNHLREAGAGPLPREAVKVFEGVSLFLAGLAWAAEADGKTALKLAFKRRRGRPRKTSADVSRYRRAGAEILKEQDDAGYHSASYAAAELFGVDRTEAQAWAGRLKREPETSEAFRRRMKLYRHAEGNFEANEQDARNMYSAALRAVQRINEGADMEQELERVTSETAGERTELHELMREIERVERWRHFNRLI